MEKITSLQREKRTHVSNFSKLKINIQDDLDKIIDKLIKFISSDLKKNEIDLSKFNQYLTFNNFTLSKIVELPKLESNCIRNSLCHDKEGFCQGYEITLKDSKDVELTLLTNSRDISKRAIKSVYWRIRNSKNYTYNQCICDAKYLYGLFTLLDITYDYCISNKEELFNFSEVSIYDNSYSEEDIHSLINMNKIKGCSTLFRLSKKMKHLIIDVAITKQLSDLNIELMKNYEKEVQHEVARAFETKKNIPDKVKSVMQNNKFLNYFKYVELDADTDLEKFHVVEKEWLQISKLFNLNELNIKPELRFRKLGKHKALGLYYPGLKCLCVDITSPSSFLHEFGHHIDYTYSDTPLSLKANFREIIKIYSRNYDKQREDNKYLKNKRNYFLTPTEVFARTFEMYLTDKIETSFLKDKKDMNISNGYPEFSKYDIKKINSYFDKFDFNFIATKEDIIKEEINKQTNLVLDEIKYTSLKQVSFF